jgi:hypothetical protein
VVQPKVEEPPVVPPKVEEVVSPSI